MNAGSYYLGLHVSPNQWDQHWSVPNQTFGQNGSDGFDHYFRLESVSAVPEPESLALMLVGLGVMGAAVRRRKQA